nr:MAG TPA: hypothetical protein [Caudoviricetes sp.]
MERGYQKLNNSRRREERLEYELSSKIDEGSRLHPRLLLLFHSN